MQSTLMSSHSSNKDSYMLSEDNNVWVSMGQKQLSAFIHDGRIEFALLLIEVSHHRFTQLTLFAKNECYIW